MVPRRRLTPRPATLLLLALGAALLGSLLPPAPRTGAALAQTIAAGQSQPAVGAGDDDQGASTSANGAQASPPEGASGPQAPPPGAPPTAPPFALPPPEALWYAQQWQQAQALSLAQQWQFQAQFTLAAWAQSVVAANLLAQQVAAVRAATRPAPAAPTPPPPPNDRTRIQQALTVDGDGLCGLAVGHVCQVGGDLAGSTVTPSGAPGATTGSQWRVIVPAGRIVAGAVATVFVPTTRGIEFFDCPAASAGAQTVCTGQTRGHALQGGTARVHVGNQVIAQGAIRGPGANVQKLLVVVPGIDGFQSNQLYDPYTRASNFFGAAVCSGFSPCTSLFQALGCPSQSGGPSTTLVPCGTSGLAWLPYSYQGVGGSGATGLPLLYTGANTGQRLALSSAAMGQIVALARALLGQSNAATAQIILIGHSLGGAVSSDWAGANAPTLPVITMDSPVSGIWPTDDAVFDPYCLHSTGLLDVYNLSTLICRALVDLPALDSPVVPDLQAAATIAREGLANAINFANPADMIVPSWYAVNRQARHGAVLFPSNCGSSDENHSCILGYAPAVSAAAAIITGGTYPTPTPIRASINLNVTVTLDGSPDPNVPITVTQGSTPGCTSDCNPPSVQVATAMTNGNGMASVSVPWRDSLVTANVGTTFGAQCLRGALPANNTDLTISVSALSGIGCDLSSPPPPAPPPARR
ncbi:MAG TPA: hypothetical protein VII06_09820 [Chloroflexota bacterium]|jgi:hypothetical protein